MKKILSHLTTDWYKYLLELIVITAGVLGAFALNSWKEQKDFETQQVVIYGFVKQDLQSDIAEIESSLVSFSKKLEALNKITQAQVSKEAFATDSAYFSSFSGYEDLHIDQRGLNLLNNSLDLNDLQSTVLANKIALFYSDHLTEVGIAEKELSNNFQRLYFEISQEEWFFEYVFMGNAKPFAEFATDNRDFQIMIGSYRIIFGIYAYELNRFRENGLQLIKEIDDHLAQ